MTMSPSETVIDLADERIRRMTDAELRHAIADTAAVAADCLSADDRLLEVRLLERLIDAARARRLLLTIV
jgi:hypothetical protein